MRRPYLLIFLFIVILNFFIPRLMPGDPFSAISAEDSQTGVRYSEVQITRYKEYYGMDKPLPTQFFTYMKRLLNGDLGYSISNSADVSELILDRLPWTVGIVLVSMFFSSAAGITAGSVSAWLRRSHADTLLYSIMLFLAEFPSFLLGILFLFILGGWLGWFPLAGGSTPFMEYSSRGAQIPDIIYHACLPVLTLTISQLGGFYLLSRASMLTVLLKDYIRTAQAKGIGRKRIIFRHALKNALPPILVRILINLGTMMGGAILVENVFQYPGVGKLLRDAVYARDYVLIQGIFLCLAFIMLSLSFISDWVYCRLDPRIEPTKFLGKSFLRKAGI